jgi:uncharacterized protein YjbI with pentapeptide repeats
MANDEHIALLRKGVAAWNAWRAENPDILPDLTGADLNRANLTRADLSKANLQGADLREAELGEANLVGAHLDKANLLHAKLPGTNLSKAELREANLSGTDLKRACLTEANLTRATLLIADLGGADLGGADLGGAELGAAKFIGANLSGAKLSSASLIAANLSGADLSSASLDYAYLFGDLTGADLHGADLHSADLTGANLTGANLRGADLTFVTLVSTNLTDADLTGCHIFGLSAWDLKLNGAKQQNLVITPRDEPEITVDNIEVAQFVYLLLHNQKIRDVIDTITSKAVLILGRFTDERKAVLDALREELRKRNYLPILFDFDVPATRDITETVSLLARMARFIIADLTDPSSIPKELEAIVPSLAVPVQPLLEGSSRPYAMFKDYWKYDWVLPVCRYEGLELLLATLAEKVISPAEGKVKALEERRRMIEAELTKPQAPR